MSVVNRDALLSHLREGDERSLGARVVDSASRLLEGSDEVAATDFLDPAQQEVVKGLVPRLDGVGHLLLGGYAGAERKRLVLFLDYLPRELIDADIRLIQARGNFPDGAPKHRDCLGSLLGTGVKRAKVGDVLVQGSGFQAAVTGDVLPLTTEALTHVGATPVTVEEIEPEQLDIAPQRVKEIRTTVASLRLDAVAGAGYSTSRSAMARQIRAGFVRLNWNEVSSPSHKVTEGDVLSIRGRGRVIVEQVGGLSRKGRARIVLKRLI